MNCGVLYVEAVAETTTLVTMASFHDDLDKPLKMLNHPGFCCGKSWWKWQQ